MILYRECRQRLMLQAFNGVVVEVDVSNKRIILQAAGIDSKAMVLRGDLNIVALPASYRLVATR